MLISELYKITANEVTFADFRGGYRLPTSAPDHHSIPSVHYWTQYNVVSDYICKLCLVEVTDVALQCLFCCNIYFGVHQYQLVYIYSSVSAYSSITVSGCSIASLATLLQYEVSVTIGMNKIYRAS